ncbi:MAG TPA: glycine--tRNA ligase subunit beta [Candidatus Anaerobiospirillum stercoravium]|nr:glycine--tRNA ligase subunit beta [Candidatus Anaerobiospirillum stercoravium]
MDKQNLLLELGTEELPPKALRKLAEALRDNFVKLLAQEGLNFSEAKWYATPRRLALFIRDLDVKQADRELEVKGPAIKAAFDADGNPTKAALGWASANGIKVEDALRLKTDKGEWLYIKQVKTGTKTVSLVRDMFAKALAALPIPKLMHWGDKHDEFVRPVHTLCMLFGSELIEGEILGVKSSKTIKGHRFMGQPELTIDSADSYVETLRTQGAVVADFEERKAAIKAQVEKLADSVHGKADLDDALLEEVTSLVEEPHVFLASFEERFLQVPSEALVYTMKGDQKYFPIYDAQGKLLPKFAFVSNINPQDTTALVSGNERVVRPRLSDAEFFFNTDRKQSLESFYPRLETIVYQQDLGTIAERSQVVAQIAATIAPMVGADVALAQRAAHLAKCDLATTLVTEFTDTQGIMGMHYAQLDGEDPDVATAIFEQYCPRFAGDLIPTKPVPVAVSLAEKLATLVGIMGINLMPKGDKDPFGLRRAAIGVIRIVIENKLELNLVDLIAKAVTFFGSKLKSQECAQNVTDYIFGRLKAYYQDQGIGAEIFQAVLSTHPVSLLDFDKRVKAVVSFKQLKEAQDLAAAYKRVNNIQAKSGRVNAAIKPELLQDEAEKKLVAHLNQLMPTINELYGQGQYDKAMATLAELRDDVDNFFEQVMVNDQNEAIKQNRLAILNELSQAFSKTADISVLY